MISMISATRAFCGGVGILLVLCAPAPAQSFPGQTPGTDLTFALPAAFEGSGAVWHPVLQKLFLVSDDGRMTVTEASGALSVTRFVPGDLEGITIADPNSNFVYIGVEDPDSVLEVRIDNGAIVRSFDLTPWMVDPANKGLEGLAFVPDPLDPEGGLFFAGEQNDGRIYKFRLPIKSSATSTAVTYLGNVQPVAGRTDIRELSWDGEHGILWCEWFTPLKIGKLTSTGTFVSEWNMIGAKPEGIAVKGCDLFVTEDNGAPSLWKYTAFPSAADCPRLATDTAHVSLALGANATFALHSDAPLPANALYLLLGSASGTVPGLLAGSVLIPLNHDGYFDLTIGAANVAPFSSTLGNFPASGFASAEIAVPAGLPPALIGLTLDHAWIGASPTTSKVLAASGAVSLTFEN